MKENNSEGYPTHDEIDADQKEVDRELEKKVERIRCGCAVNDLQDWVDDIADKHKTQISEKIQNMSIYIYLIAAFVCLTGIVTGYILVSSGGFKRNNEPMKYNDQLLDVPSFKWHYEANFFSQETTSIFRKLALNGDKLSTIVEDNGVYTAGEAVKIGHENCKHPFMTLNPERTMCHFSNRLDVGMHFVKSGGFNGHIEYLDKMVARILPFRKRLIKQKANAYDSYVNLKKLKEFNTENFHKTANTICADNNARLFDKDKTRSIVNEIFQLDILLILPGQELPMHLNVPYFWGADRNSLPHWLLVVMKNSGLFEDIFIPQVQGVSWLDTEESYLNTQKEDINFKKEFVEWTGEGGDFYLYPYLESFEKELLDGDNEKKDNKYVILKREYNSAIILDGAQVIHGVDRYRPSDLPPLFATNHHYTIKFDQNQWILRDFKNNYLRSYYKDDVKLMVVWNMHCFSNLTQQEKFHTDNHEKLSLDKIIKTFKADLKIKNKLPNEDIGAIDLWTIALKEYLRYPINTQNQITTIFGLNYCLIPNLMPESIRKIVNSLLFNDMC